MDSTDVLANISSYLSYGTTSFSTTSVYQGCKDGHPAGEGNGKTNPIWATFLTYSTKCDILHSYLTTADTTICAGEVLNLAVGGDSTYTYAWRYRGNTISTDSLLTIAPQQNRLYSILVSDTNGCSKTEIINIKVNPKPTYRLTTTNAICPNNSGTVVIDSLQGVAPPYRFRKDGGTRQTAPVYANLPQGNYQLEVLDTNGCITSQLATITCINKTIANFSLPTPLPFVPTVLNFTNQSQFASEYQWFVNGNLVSTTTNLEQAFEEAGAYAITLVASSTNEQCTDTITKIINLERENFLYIPSSWDKETTLSLTSNGYVQLEFRLVNSLGQIVRVLSKPITTGEQNLLGNKTLARGVYFYQLTATKQTGEVVEQSGKVVRL